MLINHHRNWSMKNDFHSKKNLDWFLENHFVFILSKKHFLKSCEKIINILLLVNYIKFGPQSFDYYIFCLEFFLLISSLRIWFNLIFIPIIVLIFLIFICFYFIFFLIKIFYLSILVFILLIVIYFIWNNLWNHNYYYFNFIIFQLFNL